MDPPPNRDHRGARPEASDESARTIRCSARIQKLDPDPNYAALSFAGRRKRPATDPAGVASASGGKRVAVEKERTVESVSVDAVSAGSGQADLNSVENLKDQGKKRDAKPPPGSGTATAETRENRVFYPVTFEKKVNQWNAVDVIANGTIKRGLVVGIRESGWLVDFGLPATDPELILYENIPFIRKKNTPKTLPHLTYDHPRVLLRLAHDQPWIWYDCVVRKITRTCCVAQVIGNGIVEAVGLDRILFPPGEFGKINPRRNDFVEVRLPVPPAFVLCAKFTEVWKEHFRRTRLIDVKEGCLRFLQWRRDRAVTEPELLSVLDSVADQGYSLPTLPRPILITIFSCLTVSQQQTLRPVCAVWNHAIVSYAAVQRALISYDNDYLFTKSLVIAIRNGVKSLLIKGQPRHSSTLSMLREICLLKPFKLSLLALCDAKIDAGELLTEANTVTDSVRSVCRRVALCSVRMQHLYGSVGIYSPMSYGSISYDVLDTDENVPVPKEFFEMAAGKHPYFEKREMKRLKRWVLTATKSAGAPEISQVLQKWQTDDRRFGPHIGWGKIQTALIAALMEHTLKPLRKSTVYALMCARTEYDKANAVSSESSDDDA